MRRRLTSTILLLYPRRVRDRHGHEIIGLIEDLIAHERRSRAGMFMRLAVDGLIQRIASTATAWTLVGVLAATTFGGLAVSEFAAARAPRAAHATRAPRHTHDLPRSHHTTHRSTGMIARQLRSLRLSTRR